jgi:hypothetical protein
VRAAGALGAAGRASEARVEADKALEFYRRVGAVRMIAEAELLAASVTR